MSTFNMYSSALVTFNLSRYAYKLICILLKSANNETGRSFKTKATMAAEAGCSVSTVTRALNELVQKKIIRKEQHFGNRKIVTIGRQEQNKRQTSNDYYVLFANLQSAKTVKYTCPADVITALKPNELKVYNFIAYRVGTREGFALSRREIAKACNISKSLVSSLTKALVQKGYISIKKTIKEKENMFNIFSVLKEKVEEIKAEIETEKIAFADVSKITDEICNNQVAFNNLVALKTQLESKSQSLHNQSLSFKVSTLLLFIKLRQNAQKRGLIHNARYYKHKCKISMSYLNLIVKEIFYLISKNNFSYAPTLPNYDMGVVSQ